MNIFGISINGIITGIFDSYLTIALVVSLLILIGPATLLSNQSKPKQSSYNQRRSGSRRRQEHVQPVTVKQYNALAKKQTRQFTSNSPIRFKSPSVNFNKPSKRFK